MDAIQRQIVAQRAFLGVLGVGCIVYGFRADPYWPGIGLGMGLVALGTGGLWLVDRKPGLGWLLGWGGYTLAFGVYAIFCIMPWFDTNPSYEPAFPSFQFAGIFLLGCFWLVPWQTRLRAAYTARIHETQPERVARYGAFHLSDRQFWARVGIVYGLALVGFLLLIWLI